MLAGPRVGFTYDAACSAVVIEPVATIYATPARSLLVVSPL